MIRYKPSRTYFARFRVKGKLIRRSLRTQILSVAKLRLADSEKAERQKGQSIATVIQGKMTFGDDLSVYPQRLQVNLVLKPRNNPHFIAVISAG